ncbi:metallophosphoesterase [Parasphingorhabdus halotolerans]|uniref:Calcineurin-like phosphoesterase domain-containing protein n=1 Tax=Parasphingorhabdus halotolerans TaxID=2725558 RepID=A0A6H2DNH6_9SPHN|nr:metallophosphoesterase [Parasphingorhabdus halotolerans]QJB69940.1 hypothetical protein HF685_12125 [Parasphingorhabdus halotolerans]
MVGQYLSAEKRVGENRKLVGFRGACAAILLACMAAGCSETDKASELVVEPEEEVVAVSTVAAPSPQGAFMLLSDVHLGLDKSQASGKWYCQYQCETDDALWTSAQNEAINLVNQNSAEFIIYTGDLSAHNESDSNRKSEFGQVLDGLENISSKTGKPLLYLPGNNDSDDDDYCAFTFNSEDPFDSAANPNNWPVAGGNANIISRDAANGYYSVYPLGKPAAGTGAPALRVIALNTVIFNKHYVGPRFGCNQSNYRTRQQSDSDNQLEWLSAQLADAASKKEKVILAMHIPPGYDGLGGSDNWHYSLNYLATGKNPLRQYKGQWIQDVFLQIVAHHQSEIVGMVTGHTHLNGIQRMHDCSAQQAFTELGVSASSIVTDHGSNPALKIFSYGDDYEWTGNTTYFATRPSDTSEINWKYNDLNGQETYNQFAFAENYLCTS